MSDDIIARRAQDHNPRYAHGALRRLRIMKKMCVEVTPVLMIAGVFLFSGCPERSATGTSQDRAYKRVMDTKTLRVAYISYPPSFLKDANTGTYSGIMHEVLQEMAKRMDLKVDYAEETAWGTMLEAVNGGRVDVVCTGLWPNATRGKFVDFTAAVYFSPIKAYVRAGNTAFDGKLTAINAKGVKIATIDGEMTSIISKTDFPEATADSHPQTTDIAQMLLEVGTGKADVTFVETAVAAGFLQKNPGMVEEVKNIAPIRVFPNVMMVSKDEGKLLSTLNTAMDEVANTGVVDRIVAKYETLPGLFMRRQLPYRSSP
jgi:ABC-type amino acid transport substrate-binding protein